MARRARSGSAWSSSSERDPRAGVFSVRFGIGGGVVIVAALVGIARFSIHRATGTSLVALL